MAASVSPTFQGLIPAAAIAVETRTAGSRDLLYPQEAEALERAVEKRIGEFAAGRLCARAALAQLGIMDFPLRVAADRVPLWPDGVIGCITHTDGFYVAVVAERRELKGIGIDSEVIEVLSPELEARICVPAESAWIDSLPKGERTAAAMLIFSAKEAFYKCQYPLVGEWVGFEDVSIEVVRWCPPQEAVKQGEDDAGEFIVTPLRTLALTQHVSGPVHGRYRFHQGFVSTAVVLPA